MAAGRAVPRRRDSGAVGVPPVPTPHLLGRETQCWILAAALRGGRPSWRILNVHGPAGTGKTVLLQAFRALGGAAGVPTLFFDGQRPGLEPVAVCRRIAAELAGDGGAPDGAVEGAAMERLRGLGAAQPLLLLFDRYEAFAAHDRWMRGVLMAALPPQAIVVVSTRAPLGGAWRDDEAWRRLVRPMPLPDLDLEQTRQYLTARGLRDQARAEHLWRWSRGHPGALARAAARAEREGPDALSELQGDPQVAADLAARWLEEAPSPPVRRLVEAAATCDSFDQESLEAGLGEPVTPEAFMALAALSYVRAASAGWRLEPLPRRMIAEDLGRRAPVAAARIRARMAVHFEAIATQPGDDRLRRTALRRLIHLRRGGDLRVEALYGAAEVAAARGWQVQPARDGDGPAMAAGLSAWSASWAGRGESSVAFGAPAVCADGRAGPGADRAVPAPSGRLRTLRDRHGRLLGCSLVVPLDRAGAPSPARLVWRVAADVSTGTAGLAALVLELFGLCLDADAAPVLVAVPSADAEELVRALGLERLPLPGADGRPLYRWEPAQGCWDGATAPGARAPAGTAAPAAPVSEWLRECGLTGRERDIAAALPEGLSNADIAYRLQISELTVKKHLTQIFRKTGVASRTQLVSRMLRGR